MSATSDLNALLRELAPRAIGVLARRFGDFATCEDAVQEALLAAATQWPIHGVPENPQGWLVTVASRRRIEFYRAEAARRRREELVVVREVSQSGDPGETDDTLTVLLLCCHQSLSLPSQVALTLRAVGGLTTAEIARAFLVPEATIAQRISRAKQRIKAEGATFELPPLAERSQRMDAVLRVLYLVFTEGHTASAGAALVRVDLTTEAIRLARQVRSCLPDDGEVAGLLALMLLTDARRAARVRDGSLVPLAEQDRTQWDRVAIVEGLALIEGALARTPIGPYQLQAAIAAVHADAASTDATDWQQILGLYDLLARLAPGPMVTLNRIVAVAMVRGPRVALDALGAACTDSSLANHHRADAVRGHLLELEGDHAAARAALERAARRTGSLLERRYLMSRAARLQTDTSSPPAPGG